MTVLSIVYGGQAVIYAIRQRRTVFRSRPSVWMVASSVADILSASLLAVFGMEMTNLPPLLAGEVFAAACVFAVVLAVAKLPVFAWLEITWCLATVGLIWRRSDESAPRPTATDRVTTRSTGHLWRRQAAKA